MRWFDKYKGLPRRFKGTYFLSNLLNFGTLKSNKAIYKKYGIKRSVFSALSHKVLAEQVGTMPVFDQSVLKRDSYFGIESSKLRADFDENGFVIIPEAFIKQVDGLNTCIDDLITHKKIAFNFTGNKLVFANRVSPTIDTFIKQDQILELLGFLLDWPVLAFQTINFLSGSEQAAHSDSIHMATYPEGKLTAIWIALEDIGSDQGPLFYYPGSHKLPYLHNGDLDLKENIFFLDQNPNAKYERKVAELVERSQLRKEVFLAKKGDMFVWHPNLLHGGSKHQNKDKSRKSMVVHYFGKNVVCYHELTQRPALIV